MTAKQQKLYFAEWAKCRAALRKMGRTPAEADAERKRIHARCCNGQDKSSKALSNAQLSAVLAAFWAWSHPGDLMRQLRQDPDRQASIMGRHACHEVYRLIEDIDADAVPNPLDPYLAGIFRNVNKGGSTDPDYGTADEWHKVFLACCYRYDQLARAALNLKGKKHARLWPNYHQRNLDLIDAAQPRQAASTGPF